MIHTISLPFPESVKGDVINFIVKMMFKRFRLVSFSDASPSRHIIYAYYTFSTKENVRFFLLEEYQ